MVDKSIQRAEDREELELDPDLPPDLMGV